jgi:hypothetical protein
VFGALAPEVQRDRWGRPLITPVGGGKAVGYTRCTTFVKALDDQSNLLDWKARMTLLGAAKSPTIIKSAKTYQPSDKRELKELVEQALVLAGAGDKATDGTTLHKLTELQDAGTPLPADLDADTVRDLAAYASAMRGIGQIHSEAFVVHDGLQVAGTFDRLLWIPQDPRFPEWLGGKRVVGDLKTGSLDWSIGAISMQLAVYANADLYDITTAKRVPHLADRNVGIVMHLPAGQGVCDLYAVNIDAGWEAVQLAAQVRDWRKGAKLAKLAHPIGKAA